MSRYLLDTNICIYIINQKPAPVLQRFKTLEVGELAISSVTQYELLYGAYKSTRPQSNVAAVQQFCLPLDIIPFAHAEADCCGRIRTALEKAGTPIGAMDMQIAATALVHGCVLVTNNMKEFERVEGLLLENWIC